MLSYCNLSVFGSALIFLELFGLFYDHCYGKLHYSYVEFIFVMRLIVVGIYVLGLCSGMFEYLDEYYDSLRKDRDEEEVVKGTPDEQMIRKRFCFVIAYTVILYLFLAVF